MINDSLMEIMPKDPQRDGLSDIASFIYNIEMILTAEALELSVFRSPAEY
jgi:hypothetical protein